MGTKTRLGYKPLHQLSNDLIFINPITRVSSAAVTVQLS